MEVAATAERLRQAMSERRYRQADVVRRAKPIGEKYGRTLTKNALSQYVNGKVEPKRDMIALLAEALDVDDAWLMGFDVPMERLHPVPTGKEGITEDEAELIRAFRAVPPETRMAMMTLLRSAEADRKAPGDGEEDK